MENQIDARMLRQWLEENRPVTVLDVRTDEDYAQWSIPGSMHVNAYEAIKSGHPEALSNLELPPDVPVVTICNRGIVSGVAAQRLAERGIPALSLQGGMQAWTLAWNTAHLSLAQLQITQVRRTGKGCLSYLLSSGNEAMVIDASLEPELYVELAQRQGFRIRYVLDSHIHADHLSRSRRLVEATEAELWLPQQNRAHFSYHALEDGSELHFGDSVLQAIHTPGHTGESACYFVNGQALLTGDTLFLSGVGRPDLHASSDQARQRASQLFHSLKRILALDPNVLILPAHASEPIPFNDTVLTARLGDVAVQLRGWLASEESFVERVIARIPPTPPNYAHITELNETGGFPDGDITELEAGANRCAVS